jgi:hypothetical protein
VPHSVNRNKLSSSSHGADQRGEDRQRVDESQTVAVKDDTARRKLGYVGKISIDQGLAETAKLPVMPH